MISKQDVASIGLHGLAFALAIQLADLGGSAFGLAGALGGLLIGGYGFLVINSLDMWSGGDGDRS